MKNTARLAWSQIFLIVVFALVGWVSLCTTHAEAQTTGDNAVYDSNANCCQKSPAFIDASVLLGNGSNQGVDLCDIIYGILTGRIKTTSYTTAGAVIDARGLSGTALTCTKGSPWTEGSTSVSAPSTILLPATTATAPISIPSMWSLPPNTHLIGEGDNIASSTTISTTIQAQSGFSGSMIQFGSSLCLPPLGGPSTCAGISVEKLTLDGQGQSINGIVNPYSTDHSYVDHVSLYQILGTGRVAHPNVVLFDVRVGILT